MKKKVLLTVVIAVFFSGAVFAQAGFGSMPRNNISVDVGPTIIGGLGALASNVMSAVGEEMGEDMSSSGFGIGVQYERQLLRQLSVAARFAYLGLGAGLDITEDNGITNANLDLTSFAVESRVRFYPAGRTFFLGGMLGYARMAATVSGHIEDWHDDGTIERTNLDFDVSRDYLKFGGRIGWRIDFGRPGGFFFEPSFGYYGAVGFGDTMGHRVRQQAENPDDMGDFIGTINDTFSILETFVLIGGPRLSLSFGWRF